MYKPLSSYLTIDKSSLHGLGLFAKKEININTNLGLSHIEVNGVLIRTPLGGFYNHSETPNIQRVQVSPMHWNLFTIKNIDAGEELLATYSLYTP